MEYVSKIRRNIRMRWVVVVLVPLFILVWFLLSKWPLSFFTTNIMHCDQKKNIGKYECQYGGFFELALGVPIESCVTSNAFPMLVSFSGNDGRDINCLITFDEIKQVGWLKPSKQLAYYLPWQRAPLSYSNQIYILTPGITYKVEITTSDLLPKGSSLWLCYLSNWPLRCKGVVRKWFTRQKPQLIPLPKGVQGDSVTENKWKTKVRKEQSRE